MSKIARKRLFVDKSKKWNLEEPAAGATSNMKTKIISILFRYIWYDVHVESLLKIKGSSRNLTAMGIIEKNNFLKYWTVLYPALSTQLIFFFDNKVRRIFVPNFFHDKRAENFLKYLEYVGEYGPDNVRCEYLEVGRKYYKNKKSTSGSSVKSLLVTDSD